MTNHNLLIFELGYGGHYASYIRYLAEYWCQQKLLGSLNFVVSPNFVEQHPDVIAIAQNNSAANLNFISITSAEATKLVPRKNSVYRAIRSFQEWRLLGQYAKKLQATHCLLLYFDSFQAAIALGLKLPCPFSGIYFRPTFHYPSFVNYSPTKKERLLHIREKFIILPRVMNHPQIANLFCLDPYVVKHLEQFNSSAKALYLPDPVPITEVAENELRAFKQKLGIESDRKAFLLFGALYDGRKSLEQVLDAISLLPCDLCQKICLLLVGQIYLQNNPILAAKIDGISQKFPIQIIIRDEFVPEEDVQLYYQSVDVILAPYQRHVGMSGTLVHAAAAQKPILTSDYGLMGEITRQWQLGLTVDSTSPDEIASRIAICLQQNAENLSDRKKMETFARQNSTTCFASSIFNNLKS
jgi:glycosyltransferase involved in cell wall biosynthesis